LPWLIDSSEEDLRIIESPEEGTAGISSADLIIDITDANAHLPTIKSLPSPSIAQQSTEQGPDLLPLRKERVKRAFRESLRRNRNLYTRLSHL
jgi:hypothetical protein